MNSTWHLIRNPPTEEQLLEDIAAYERDARKIGDTDNRPLAKICLAYRIYAKYLRKLLAAMRDGRPSAWTEYGPV